MDRADLILLFLSFRLYEHRINKLTDRGMPPTSHIFRNLAEDIRGEPVGQANS
jgi:hypothetical protein